MGGSALRMVLIVASVSYYLGGKILMLTIILYKYEELSVDIFYPAFVGCNVSKREF